MSKRNTMDDEIPLKFLAIGDSGVGKTSLLNQYVDGQYNEKLAPTVGIDMRHKFIQYKSPRTNKSQNIHLQLWDTAGQERFRSLTASFFRDASGFLLVFDVTNEESFLNVRNWISEIQSNSYSEDIDIILVGNKCDLEKDRVITHARAMQFGQENRVEYIETSALHNINVTESIKLLLESVMERSDQNSDISKTDRLSSKRKFDTLITQTIDDINRQEQAEARKKSSTFCCNY